MAITGAHMKDKVDEIAENPYFRFLSRFMMMVVSAIAIPYVYWLTNNMITLINTVGGVSIIQTQQQQQITSIIQTQSKMLDSQAVEATARATQDAADSSQLDSLKAQANRNTESIDKIDDRINQMNQLIFQPQKR